MVMITTTKKCNAIQRRRRKRMNVRKRKVGWWIFDTPSQKRMDFFFVAGNSETTMDRRVRTKKRTPSTVSVDESNRNLNQPRRSGRTSLSKITYVRENRFVHVPLKRMVPTSKKRPCITRNFPVSFSSQNQQLTKQKKTKKSKQQHRTYKHNK